MLKTLLLGGRNMAAKEKESWLPCKISPEAQLRLKLAAALTGREMRELASEAILSHCSQIVAHRMHLADSATSKKKSKK